MSRNLFDVASFNMGWELPLRIPLFERTYPIVVSADACYEYEKVTAQQISAYSNFLETQDDILLKIENALVKEAGNKETAINRFKPAMLVIRKNGDYAMLFDDADEPENGIAICIKPKFEVMTSDEYL